MLFLHDRTNLDVAALLRSRRPTRAPTSLPERIGRRLAKCTEGTPLPRRTVVTPSFLLLALVQVAGLPRRVTRLVATAAAVARAEARIGERRCSSDRADRGGENRCSQFPLHAAEPLSPPPAGGAGLIPLLQRPGERFNSGTASLVPPLGSCAGRSRLSSSERPRLFVVAWRR